MLTKQYGQDLRPRTEDQLLSFKTLKKALGSAPTLRLPGSGLPYSVQTDASDYRVRCALFQDHPEEGRHPIGYCSRSLNVAEENYSVTEKEGLAVVYTTKILHPDLERKRFSIHTDHQTLRWIINLSETQGRLAR